MKALLRIAVAAVETLLLGALLGTAQVCHYQSHLQRRLSAALGFKPGLPYIRCGDTKTKVLTIRSVQEGGLFDHAGFQSGDIIVGMSLTEFYRTLQRGRGGEVTVSVADGGDGPPLSERRIRQIRFTVQ